MRKAAIIFFALCMCASCKKQSEDVQISHWMLDNSFKNWTDSNYLSWRPSSLFEFRQIAPLDNDTAKLRLEFYSPYKMGNFRLVSYPDYYKNNFQESNEFHMRLFYKNHYYRNYKSAFLCGVLRQLDTLIQGNRYQSKHFSFNNVPLQNADDNTDQKLLSASVELGFGSLISHLSLATDSISYNLRLERSGGSCGYSWVFVPKEGSYLQIAFGSKPATDKTFYLKNDICQNSDALIVYLFDPSSTEFYYSEQDSSQYGRAVKVVRDGDKYKLSLDNIALKGPSKTIILTHADFYFEVE